MESKNSVVICGFGEYGKILYDILSANGMSVTAFIDNAIEKWNIQYNSINVIPAFKANQIEKLTDYFIIPGTYSTKIIEDIYYQLRTLNISKDKICVAPMEMLKNEWYNDDCEMGGIKIYKEWCALPYLEFPVALHCNQQCAACLHFSPLSEKHFYDTKKFKKDIAQLKELVSHIETIRVMGGEPLLNPDLNQILDFTRNIYPYSTIVLVSNGILIKRMPKELIETIVNTNTIVKISLYPSIYQEAESIYDFLNENNIRYSKPDIITFFKKGLYADKRENPYFPNKPEMCRCLNMFEGKLSVCPMAMYVGILNQKFGTSFPENGYWKIESVLKDMDKFKENLKKAVDLCEYCRIYSGWNKVNMAEKWKLTKGICKKVDWFEG
jgi:hypothetical protein